MSDILLLSLGTTIGLRAGDDALAELMREAGASVEVARVRIGATGRLRRAYPVIDLVEAAAARRALETALPRARPRAVVFSTSTSTLFAPRLAVPYAIRFDSPSRLNRPGARNALQHALERRRMRDARLLLPFSDAAARALPRGAAPAVVVHESVLPSGSPAERERLAAAPKRERLAVPPERERLAAAPERERLAVTPERERLAVPPERERLAVAYTPDPKAKGLDLVVAAWTAAALPDARLEVFGISPELARRHLARHGLAEPPDLVWRGRVEAAEFRSALRRARVFLNAARWEDFGRAQLEALADGALLVSGATGGAFEAALHARELDPALSAPDLLPASLARALRHAFALDAQEQQRYRRAATERMAAYRPEAARALIAERVLPALLP